VAGIIVALLVLLFIIHHLANGFGGHMRHGHIAP
jgi:hypothetical protein